MIKKLLAFLRLEFLDIYCHKKKRYSTLQSAFKGEGNAGAIIRKKK